MRPLAESPDSLVHGSAVMPDFVHRLAGFGPGALRLLGQALQERRGTPAEQAGDADRVRLIDREIHRRWEGLYAPTEFRSARPVGA